MPLEMVKDKDGISRITRTKGLRAIKTPNSREKANIVTIPIHRTNTPIDLILKNQGKGISTNKTKQEI